MKKSKFSKIIKDGNSKINYKILATTLSLVVVDILLIWLFSYEWNILNTLRVVMLSFWGTVLSLLIGFALWETVAKRSFAEDVIFLSNISSNLKSSGVEQVYVNFFNIDWNIVLNEAKELTIAFSYGQTWRNLNRQALDEFCNNGGKIKVYFPNNEDDDITDTLDRRFSYEKGKTKQLIAESVNDFKELNAEILFFNGTFQNSYYVVDDIAFMSFFNHHKEKGSVPAIKAIKGGNLYSYIESELEAIKQNSLEVNYI